MNRLGSLPLAFGSPDLHSISTAGFPGGASGKEPTYQCSQMPETRVWPQGQEDPMATYSTILAWRTPWTEKPGWRATHSQSVKHNWSSFPCRIKHCMYKSPQGFNPLFRLMSEFSQWDTQPALPQRNSEFLENELEAPKRFLELTISIPQFSELRAGWK